jgi:transcriptional regulator with XRE-family HTH domain
MELNDIKKNDTELKEINASIQSYLREKANLSGMSDSEIAQKSKIPQSTVYRLLNAKTMSPSFGHVLRLCQTLNIDLPSVNKIPIRQSRDTIFLGDASKLKEEDTSSLSILSTYSIDSSLKRSFVIDDCSSELCPASSYVFYSEIRCPSQINRNQKVIVKISTNNIDKFIPMIVLSSPNEEQWLFWQLTMNNTNHMTFAMDKTGLKTSKKDKTITIVGSIKYTLIPEVV